MAGNPLLRYALTTNQFPLQASAGTGGLNVVQMTITGTNPNASPDRHPVVLQGISMTLPIGQDAADLTADASNIGPVPPTGWGPPTTTAGDGWMTYTFFPNEGNEGVGGEGLTFVFNNVEINRQSGSAIVTLEEGSNNCDTDCPSVDLAAEKFPSGWGQVSFWIVPPVVDTAGQAVTLNWAGPQSATYAIDYYDWSTGKAVHLADLASSGSVPGIAVYQSTTFTLSVQANVGGTLYSSQNQQTATVPDREIAIISFKAVPDYVPPNYPVSLQWKTKWATIWTLIPGSVPVPVPDPSPGGYQIEAGMQVTAPASGAITYSLQAEDAQGNQLSTPTIVTTDNTIVTGSIAADFPGPQGETGAWGTTGADNGWHTDAGPGGPGGPAGPGGPGPQLTVVLSLFDRWLLKVQLTSSANPSQPQTWLVAPSGKLTVTSIGGKGGTGGPGGGGGYGGPEQVGGKDDTYRPCGGDGGSGGQGGPGSVGGDIVVTCPASLEQQARASFEAMSLPGPAGDPGAGGNPGFSATSPCSGKMSSRGEPGSPGTPGTAGRVTWSIQSDGKSSTGRFVKLRARLRAR